MPFDYKKNAECFIKIVKPKVIIFCRNDFWYNFLKVAKEKSIPTIHLSTLLNSKSKFLKRPQLWHYKKTFNYFSLLQIGRAHV